MEDDNAQNDSSISPKASDLGPWCLGLPSSGTRVFTQRERKETLNVLVNQLFWVSAWLLPLPIGAIAIAMHSQGATRNIVPALIVSGVLDLVFAAALALTEDNPLWRSYLALRDYRHGNVQGFEGRFDPSKYETPKNSFHSKRAQQIRKDTEFVIKRRSETNLRLCRLPISGRICSINGLQHWDWVEVEITGIECSKSNQASSETGTSLCWGDGTIFILLMTVFATAIVNDIWSPPWYMVVLTFCSLSWIAIRVVQAIERKDLKMMEGHRKSKE